MKKYYNEGNPDLENRNIVIDEKNKHIELQSYTEELCLKFIPPLLEIIQLKFPEDFSVYLGGAHNFDGLEETNVALLKQGGELIDNYSGQSTTIRKVA